jgi:predicted ATPase
LVTSRVTLGLPAERRVEMEALPVPGADASPDQVRQNDSVRLLAARAYAILHSAPDSEEIADLAAVARRVEGIPLALELAAARLEVLNARQLGERLEQSFAALGRGTSGDGDRHSTLYRAIDASWQTLTPAEQSALSQAWVFIAGFDLEAAERVIDLSDQASSPEVLDVLHALCRKGLLRVLARDPKVVPRYAMYEAIREVAGQKLSSTSLQAVQERHDAYFVGAGTAWGQQATGQNAGLMVRRLAADYENMAGVLRRCLALRPFTAETGGSVLDAYLALSPYIRTRLPRFFRRSLLTQVVEAAAEVDPHDRRWLTVWLDEVFVLQQSGARPRALESCQRLIALSKVLGDASFEGQAWLESSRIQGHLGRLGEAQQSALEALRVIAHLGPRGGWASPMTSRAWPCSATSSRSPRPTCTRPSRSRADSDDSASGQVFSHLAMLALYRGEIDRARQWVAQALDVYRAIQALC